LWTECLVSPDEHTLAVIGCPWAGSYEVEFYDMPSLIKGIVKPIPCTKYVWDDTNSINPVEPKWNEDNSFQACMTNAYYVPLSKYEDDLTCEEREHISLNEDRKDLSKWRADPHYFIKLKRNGDEMDVLEFHDSEEI
jgi:hypothetical protein